MTASPFRRKTLAWLIAAGSLSLLSALFWGVFGDELTGRGSFRADSFSRSLIGHHAFLALLRELEVPVVVSRWSSGGKAGGRALLLLAEPRLFDERFRDAGALRRAVKRAEHVLLVLPKWEGRSSPARDGWVDGLVLVNPIEIQETLAELGIEAEVVRDGVSRWQDREIGLTPSFSGQVQLLESEAVAPIVHDGGRILFGKVRGRSNDLYLLTDPDLLSTQGLGRGDNAALAVRMVDWARGEGDRPVVVDEAFHGFLQKPNIYRALFRFPLLLATAQACLALGILLWAATGRFGAPSPVAPPLAPGKAFLIENIAALLQFGRQGGHVLRRYLGAARREASLKLHLPPALDEAGERDWLDRLGRERGVAPGLGRLEKEVARVGRGETGRVIAVARSIHRWKEEMIHGPSRRA